MKSRRPPTVVLLLAITWSAARLALGSQTVTYPFFGITHTDRTETSPRPLRIHVITIDLGNPSVSFLVTPQSGPRDTLIQTTRQFLTTHSAQVAINAHFFTPFPDDGTGTTWLVSLAASSATLGPRGHAYAPFERNLGGAFQNDLPALNLGADNSATIVYQALSDVTGYVTDPLVTLYNAVSGNEQLLRNGLDVSGTTTFDLTLNPRTAIGIAPGNRLVLCTVDGRQPGVSEGVTTSELATLLLSDYGVTDAINLDGGGSTILVFGDPAPRLVNVPVGVNNVPGSERLVGSSLAVFAGRCSAATEGMSCGDGDPCNGEETCIVGVCQPGAAPDCDDANLCTEDACVAGTGCVHTSQACSMTVGAAGSRYLVVTPPAGLAAVALKVSAPVLSCLPKYIDEAGQLVAAPVFQSSEQWGTIQVSDRAIVPAVDYAVTAEAAGTGPIASASARTANWGNADGQDDVTVFDIICVLDGSQNIFTRCPLRSDDQGAGVPDGLIDLSDIMATLDAFSGAAYPDPDPCAGP